MSTNYFNLRNVKSPWNGEYYIGFVLDVVNRYLDWNPDCYLPRGHGDLSMVDGMSMVKWNKKRKRNDVIRIIRSREDRDFYLIDGFPDYIDFSDFEKRVQGMWDNYYDEMFRDYYNSLNKGARERLNEKA